MTQVPVRLRERKTTPGHCCEAAARLGAFGDELVAWVKQGSVTELRVNQAKLRLLDRYVAERNGSPAAHRDRIQGEDGATCVHGQFLATYYRLHVIHMEAFPPPLARAQKPKEPPAAPEPPKPKTVEEAMAEALLNTLY